MGVEYTHFLVVGDKDWLPQPDTLVRVEEVLRKWSLVGAVDKVFDLASMTEASEHVVPIGPTGPGKALVYKNAAQGKCVEDVAGPSYYDTITSEQRYISTVIAVAGTDFRIQQSDNYCYFENISPLQGKKAQHAPERDIPWPVNSAFYEYQSGAPSTPPPVVKIHLNEHWRGLYEWQSFNGYWRGGVVLDFGKDLPAFCEAKRALPSRQFVEELAIAFRGPLVEVGVVD